LEALPQIHPLIPAKAGIQAFLPWLADPADRSGSEAEDSK
jgi:hypothetical protein